MGRLAKIASLLRFAYVWKIRKRSIVPTMPLEVSLEVTNVCNFKCSFCSQSNPTHFDKIGKHHLTADQARTILGKIREFGYKKDLIHWTLDGEPFVHMSFAELCEIARDFGFTNQYSATNGLLATVERVRALPLGVDYTFTVDFCGDRKYFESNRGTNGSWEKIKDNITQILLDDSLGHIRFTLTDISTFGVEDTSLVKRNADGMRRLFPTSDRIKFLSKTFHNAAGFLPNKQAGENGSYNLCPYPWSSIKIASNGDVVACCRDLEHKTVLGNVFEEPLVDIWNGERFQHMRRSLARRSPEDVSACANCDMPFDGSKFTAGNIVSTLLNRLQLLR